ncbi:glycosyl transferase group 1 [Pseudoxanthomonas suwonensis 11-1]|uniref:Glycosyl transferase group 1 n=2 Tax=Pseudoxanthomonas suwonensis TaxID=314722 RepID=E6WQS1_PSEUU|nr:glycosyl transferase group 1 [Pseudoxanthomonas suwonensis 11-1]
MTGETPTAARPRAILVTRNLPPLRGGMERLNWHVAIALSRRFDLLVIGPRGCSGHLPPGIRVREIPAQGAAGFLPRAAAAAWSASSEPAELVLAGSGLTAPLAYLAGRRSGARSMAYVHGLDLVTRHPVYRMLWMPFLRRLGLAIANSANTASIARGLAVAGGNIAVVHPGTRLPGDVPGGGDFRRRFALGEGPLLLSVGRLTERKGIVEFIERCLPAIVAAHPGARLVLVGDNAQDALNRSTTDPRARLDAAITRAGMGAHVAILGPCDDATLSQAYAGCDLHVFPVRSIPGDVEGFGMVAIEAAAHGLPTVAFAAGGVPDAVKPGTSGVLVAEEDYQGFAREVCTLLAGDPTPLRASAKVFATSFSWERFDRQLLDLLDTREPARA